MRLLAYRGIGLFYNKDSTKCLLSIPMPFKSGLLRQATSLKSISCAEFSLFAKSFALKKLLSPNNKKNPAD